MPTLVTPTPGHFVGTVFLATYLLLPEKSNRFHQGAARLLKPGFIGHRQQVHADVHKHVLVNVASSVPTVCCCPSTREGKWLLFLSLMFSARRFLCCRVLPLCLPSCTTSTPKTQAVSQSCYINIKSKKKKKINGKFSLGDN